MTTSVGPELTAGIHVDVGTEALPGRGLHTTDVEGHLGRATTGVHDVHRSGADENGFDDP